MAYLFGVDGGTESIRAIVFDLDGRPKGSHASAYQTGFPNPGWAEQNDRHRRRPRRNPDDWWRSMDSRRAVRWLHSIRSIATSIAALKEVREISVPRDART